MNSFEDFEPDTELEEDHAGIWLSISDLMSGLLMFFALLFIIVQVQLQQEMLQAQKLRKELEQEILKTKKLEQKLEQEILKAQKLERELEAYKKIIDQLPLRIISAIEGKFGQGVVEVDPKTGDVKIGDRILFDEGSAELKPAGKQFLKRFIPIYSDVIFSDKLFESQITRVVIEGHTSSKGSDKTNMELSLRRALSVSDYIFSQQLNFKTKQKFKQKILASGRGEIDADQSQDKPSDRKVVFRFQFRREDFGELLKRANTVEKSATQ
ncbi:MAG: OmpA family protein [Xenococcaceae cyanobacterium MO_167.B52]|nr:OmpA family protein [Xenococcaceae cyanobacterium MO_167.B52]